MATVMVPSVSMNHDVWQVFKNCPRCGAVLHLEQGGDGPALRCSIDGFVFYQNPHSAVAAIITNLAGEILLIKRAKEPKINCWDLPGGFVNWGEAPDRAVIREVREELGVVFTPQKILSAGHDWYLFDGLMTSANTIDYLGTVAGTIKSNDEIGSLHWFAPADLPDHDIAFASVTKTLNLLRKKS